MKEITDFYKTIEKPSEGQYKEKGSKFMAFAFPVNSEEKIKDHIQFLKKKYFDASHYCYAYALGLNREKSRMSDDREPSGTGGKPIFGQIISFGLTNIVILVVRYFGGSLLGKSGLSKAYRQAAGDALRNATIIEETLNSFFKISFDYKVMNQIMHLLKKEKISPLNHQFNQNCSMAIPIRNSRIEKIKTKLEKIDSVKIEIMNTI